MGNIVSFKREFGFILVGAIIFTASLLWKDTIVEIEEKFFPKSHGIMVRITFTIVITIMLVALAVHLKDFLGLNTPNANDIRNLTTHHFSENPIDYVSEKKVHYPMYMNSEFSL